MVETGVLHNAIELRVKRPLRVEAVDRTIGLHKRFLREIEGVVPVSHKTIRDRVGPLPIQGRQRAECCAVAPLGLVQCRSSSRPTVLAQYPRDQKLRPNSAPFVFVNSRWTRTALFHFKYPIVMATPYLGGMPNTMWI